MIRNFLILVFIGSFVSCSVFLDRRCCEYGKCTRHDGKARREHKKLTRVPRSSKKVESWVNDGKGSAMEKRRKKNHKKPKGGTKSPPQKGVDPIK